jgi:hypothetical protein
MASDCSSHVVSAASRFNRNHMKVRVHGSLSLQVPSPGVSHVSEDLHSCSAKRRPSPPTLLGAPNRVSLVTHTCHACDGVRVSAIVHSSNNRIIRRSFPMRHTRPDGSSNSIGPLDLETWLSWCYCCCRRQFLLPGWSGKVVLPGVAGTFGATRGCIQLHNTVHGRQRVQPVSAAAVASSSCCMPSFKLG